MIIPGENSLITVGTQTMATEYGSAKAQLEGNDTHTHRFVGVLYHSSIQQLYSRSECHSSSAAG